MTEKYDKLCELLSRKNINWTEVESIIKSFGDHINERFYDDDTILSALYLDSDPYEHGENLVELTRLFLQYGYDVNKNNDFNGAICLRNLCWASYDKYVLHTAELLLNAGANTRIKTDDDEQDGVLDSISWKLGYWNTGEYDSANMFEAYYQMVQAEQSGEDYRGIRDVSECLNMTVTRVECLNAPDITNNRISFNDAIVIWFDLMPLVVDKRVELVVNPNRVNKESHRVDLSVAFSKIIGHKFINYNFSDGGCASLLFGGGIELILSNNWSGREQDFLGYLEIKSESAGDRLEC